MQKFWVLIEVLYKGHELRNKAQWKTVSGLGTFVALLITYINSFGIDGLHIGDVDAKHITDGIVSLMLVFTGYLNVATSASIGLKK